MTNLAVRQVVDIGPAIADAGINDYPGGAVLRYG